MSRYTEETQAKWLARITEGFHPTYTYPDGSEENKVACIGEVVWRNPKNAEHRAKATYNIYHMRGDLSFSVGSGPMPKLPLKAHGEAWSTGWDIPTCWAIDGDGRCWKDGAHGGSMHLTDHNGLLMEFENEQERDRVREHLGLPKLEPSWMTAARAAGWTPPK